MKSIKSIFDLKYNVAEFSTIEAATRFAEKCVKPHAVILGSSGKFWAACFCDAQKLVKAGYEVAA